MSQNLEILQQIAGKYLNPASLLVAGGPLALAGLVRICVAKKSKFTSLALAGGTGWFAIKELSGPVMGLIQDNFGQLQSVLGSTR